MTDRLDRAHALRTAIHGWLAGHPNSPMSALIAAFPHIPDPTVRKTVQWLNKARCISKHGDGTATRYRAVSGSVVTSVADMRERMRTHNLDALHSANQDRNTRAWEERHAMHGWIKQHPLSSMDAIAAAFPGKAKGTLQKHIRCLCKKGNIAMHGKGRASRYACTSAEIYALESVREQMRATGRRLGEKKTARVTELQACQAQLVIGGKCRNRPDRQRPLANQGGQFATSAALNGFSSLDMLA